MPNTFNGVTGNTNDGSDSGGGRLDFHIGFYNYLLDRATEEHVMNNVPRTFMYLLLKWPTNLIIVNDQHN